MNVYRRFFKITSGEMLTKIKEIRDINSIALKEYKDILVEIGAEEKFYIRDGKLVGIIFKDEPDRCLYKPLKFGWWPKKNTRAGKELNKKLKDIKTLPENSCLRLVGLSEHPSIFRAGKAYIPTMVVIPSTPLMLLVTVPWYDEDPEVIEKYKADKNHMSTNLDSILWEPSPEMEEIKEWQYLKEINDWNESIKPA